MKLTKNLILLSIFILLIITGCNSEKSNNHSKNTQNNNIVSGLLAKGPIKNSIVEIRRLDTNTLLARTKTNDKGKYSVSIGSFVGAVSVFSEGGKYIDEIDGQEKDATNVTLKAISVVNKIEGFIVNITPITSIAVKKLEKLYLNKDIMSRNEEAIIKENKKIAKILTGEDFNPTKITPNILGQDEIQDDTSSSKYGLLLASFAKLTNSDSSEVEKQIKQFEEAIRDDILSKEKAEELKDTLSDSLIQNNVSQEVKNSITQASNTQSLLDIIRKYIEDSSSSNPPTLEDYLNTTLSNINANNLDEINTLILSKELNEVSTLEQIQVLINSTIDTTAPSIVSLSFTSNAKTYVSGDDINISVVFNENVIITNTPSIDIKIGNNTKQASYVSGSGASTLVFTYTVVSGDVDINGIEVLTNTLVLNTGSIKDVVGNSSTLTHSAISQDANRLVDTTAPNIVSLSFTSNAKTYVSGDDINISVVFNENVIITNTPSIDIKIGNNTKQASYVSGSGASTLVFTYTVVSGDVDINGIEVLTNTLVLNTGSIKDVVGNSSTLTHSAISQDSSRKVYTPILNILSHTNNQNISIKDAFNIILSGTSNVEGKGVIISHNGTELETATVLNTTWTANSISFLDGKSRTYINGGVVSTDVVSFNGDKEQSLKAILDRNKSSTGILDYSVRPQNADGKYISIKFPNTYVKGVYRYYNRVHCCKKRVEGSRVKFLLNDIILWTSKGISNAGNIVTITPPEHIVFDEVKIVFSGWTQSFREIEVDGIPFEKNFNLVLKVTDDTNTETVENLNLNIGLNLASTSVNEGDTLDAEFANSQNGSGFVLGLNKSPQLTWGGASSDTTSYAIIMDDTTTGASNWIHWNVFNIPVSTTSLVEHWSATHANADVDGIQQRTAQGITNPLNKYVGPWPPAGGGTHTYQIKVYALKSTMPILDGTNIAINTVEFEATHAQHIINSSILNFNYTNP